MRALCGIGSISCVVVLSGCMGTPVTTTNTQTIQVQGAALKGRVHGGQFPVSGSVIQLYVASGGGGGTEDQALISGAALTTPGVALTDANGNFDITGQYTCPSSSTLVFITATGGNPGLGGDTIDNSALVLMAALGPCGSLASLSGPIVINEVTTVASVYALAQFISPGPGGVGEWVTWYSPYPQTLTYLTTAFSEVLNIVDIYTGDARTQTSSGVGYVPQAEIYSLANILAPCVNSSGPSSSSCQSLFAAATPSGGTAPTTVLRALLDIAQNPGNNVSTIYNLSTPAAPFGPALTKAPNDWTLAIAYSVASINYPYSMALDAQGNIWISAWVGNNPFSAEIAVISPIGVPVSNSPYTSSGNLSGPVGLAVDGSGNTWVANCVADSTSAFTLKSNTITLSYGPFGIAGMSCPLLVGVGDGGIWFTNNGNNNLIQLQSPYSATNYNTYSGGSLDKPVGIAFFQYYDPSFVSTVWVANTGSDSLTEFGGPGGPSNYTGGGLSDPGGIAVDSLGNMWAEGGSANQVAEFSKTGSAVSPAGGWTGGGLDGPSGIAIDGANNVWITNKTNSSLTEFNNSGTPITPSTGYQSSTLHGAAWISIDASGNVWILNTDETAPGYMTVTEFLGVASPATMPLQEALPVI